MKCRKCGYNRTVEELHVVRLEKALEDSIPKHILREKIVEVDLERKAHLLTSKQTVEEFKKVLLNSEEDLK